MAHHIHFFDAYGTLFDVHSAVERFRSIVGPKADRLSEIWRSKQLEYTWVYSLTGRTVGFRSLLGRSLDFASVQAGVSLAGDLRADLLAAYDSLTPYPEVRETLIGLKRKGVRVAILSNGDPDMLDRAATTAGIRDVLDAILSVSDVGVFKPSGRVYRMGLTKFGANREDATFVSSNRWDVAGAQAFGLRTVWVNRTAMPDEYPDLAPGIVIDRLDQLPALAA